MSCCECRDCRELAMLSQEIEEKNRQIATLERENDELLREVRRLRAVVRSYEE